MAKFGSRPLGRVHGLSRRSRGAVPAKGPGWRAWLVVLSLLAGAVGLHLEPDAPPPPVGIGTLRREPATPRATGAVPGGVRALTGAARVIDGDTLDLPGARIRLHGIDAPERDQRCPGGPASLRDCGVVATGMLRGLVRGGGLACTPVAVDRYGRTVATCRANGLDVGAALVAQGWARADVRYGSPYVAAERAARTQRLGLWQTAWQAPWDHRAAARRH